MTERILYVSPKGRDGNPGTKKQPFRTITAARDRARTIGEAVTVEVGAGVYRENLAFDERDSGHTYLTREGAVLTGGVRVPYGGTEAVPDEMRARLETEEKVRAIDLKRYGVGKEGYGKDEV